MDQQDPVGRALPILGEPEPSLHRLFLWGDLTIRSKRKALRSFATAPDSFQRSNALALFAGELEKSANWAVDYELSGDSSRFLVVATRRDGFNRHVAWIARECQERGLIAFDPEGEQILSHPGAAASASGDEELATLRRVVTGAARAPVDAGELGRIVLVEMGTSGEAYLPGPVWLPFDVPIALRFLIPIEIPAAKQSPRRLRGYLADLEADRPHIRRAAALDLGGWGPSAPVDSALHFIARRDLDRYVRSVAALSLAVRGSITESDIVSAAQRSTFDGRDQYGPLSDTILALCAAIGAISHRTGVELAHQLLFEGPIPAGEAERRNAVLALLKEHQ